jgi:hypothetical protein
VLQSRGKLAVNLRQYVLECHGKLRGKIAAKSRQNHDMANSRQIFFSMRQILPQIYREILPRVNSQKIFAENVRLICRAREKKFCHVEKIIFAASLPRRGKISR